MHISTRRLLVSHLLELCDSHDAYRRCGSSVIDLGRYDGLARWRSSACLSDECREERRLFVVKIVLACSLETTDSHSG